jgi:hypothetical protein
MILRDQILAAANAYCKASGMSRARLSTLILKSGARLDQLAEGRDLNTGTFEAAMRWLSDNWPEGADWPDGVARPVPLTPHGVPAHPEVQP